MPSRYRLVEHPDFTEALSREDLLALEQHGSIARGDLCEDEASGRCHTVGELIQDVRGTRWMRVPRPAYLEIRADHAAAGEEDPDEEYGDLDEFPEHAANGERVLFHGHPSWLSYSKALFLCLLLAAAGALAVPFGLRYAALGFLWSSAAFTCVGIARFSRDYLITEERVEVLWGVIGRSSKEVRVRDIRAIDVRENWISGLLGLGSVDFSSAGNAGVEVAFEYVRRAHQVKELVRQLQKLADRNRD